MKYIRQQREKWKALKPRRAQQRWRYASKRKSKQIRTSQCSPSMVSMLGFGERSNTGGDLKSTFFFSLRAGSLCSTKYDNHVLVIFCEVPWTFKLWAKRITVSDLRHTATRTQLLNAARTNAPSYFGRRFQYEVCRPSIAVEATKWQDFF